VIFNPVAARGRAARRAETLRTVLGSQIELWPTERAGHAETLAKEAASNGFSLVVAAGGDGTVHEVANGILRARRPEVVFGVMPLGSANDYAYSLHKSFSANEAAPCGNLVDIGHVRADNGRERFFVNTLGLGFSSAVTIESRRIAYLQGLLLYGLAFLRALWRHHACPIMRCTLDSQLREGPTLSMTLAIGHREGALTVAPQAQLDDGWFDYLQAGQMSRWEVLRYLPKLASGGPLPADHPALWQGRCREVRLESTVPLTIHLDGEFFSRSEDNVRTIEVRLLPAALRVRTVDPAAPG
jgi:diacylglycerol kinase family enzyme